jgi:hypothetical protein
MTNDVIQMLRLVMVGLVPAISLRAGMAAPPQSGSRRLAVARRRAMSTVIYGDASNEKTLNINELLIDDRHWHL